MKERLTMAKLLDMINHQISLVSSSPVANTAQSKLNLLSFISMYVTYANFLEPNQSSTMSNDKHVAYRSKRKSMLRIFFKGSFVYSEAARCEGCAASPSCCDHVKKRCLAFSGFFFLYSVMLKMS